MRHPTVDFTQQELALIVAMHAWSTSEIGNRLRAAGKDLPDADARRLISDHLQDVIAAVVLGIRDRKDVPPNTEFLELVGGLVEGAIYRYCESPEERRGRMRRIN